MKKIILFIALLSVNAFAAPVNINSADAKTIASSLKGIGIKKAEAIVRYRKKHGSFKNIDELQKVKGVGKKTIQKNKSDIRIKGGSAIKTKTKKNKVAKKTLKKQKMKDKKKKGKDSKKKN